jgi:hypothetical protein
LVACELLKLHDQAPFDVANVELRWAGLTHELVLGSLRRLLEDVTPLIEKNARNDRTLE